VVGAFNISLISYKPWI